jgi:hypothetical protein
MGGYTCPIICTLSVFRVLCPSICLSVCPTVFLHALHAHVCVRVPKHPHAHLHRQRRGRGDAAAPGREPCDVRGLPAIPQLHEAPSVSIQRADVQERCADVDRWRRAMHETGEPEVDRLPGACSGSMSLCMCARRRTLGWIASQAPKLHPKPPTQAPNLDPRPSTSGRP